jgi:hypothetical protein
MSETRKPLSGDNQVTRYRGCGRPTSAPRFRALRRTD